MMSAEIPRTTYPNATGVPDRRRLHRGQDGIDRSGLTLMELLVAIMILSLVTAVTMPLLDPQLGPRRIREAARLVSGAISSARNRAITDGHPVGVILERQAGANSGACVKLFYAEQPAPYSGETVTSTVSVSGGSVDFNNGSNPNPNMNLINVGDLVQLNYQGFLYQITSKSGSKCDLSSPMSPVGKPPDMGNVPFQVFRLPQSSGPYSLKSGEKPIQLPAGVVVDLANSGYGGSNTFSNSTDSIILLFNANGSLDRVFGGGMTGNINNDTVHLHIGWIDKLGQGNLDDPGALWVSVGFLTGLVTTGDNAVTDGGNTTVAAARAIAVKLESIGGR